MTRGPACAPEEEASGEMESDPLRPFPGVTRSRTSSARTMALPLSLVSKPSSAGVADREKRSAMPFQERVRLCRARGREKGKRT